MSVRGITFDSQLITSADMAHLYWVLFGKKSGITKGCTVSYSGSNLYVTAGRMLSHGRYSAVSGSETIAAPTVTEGTLYCRLVYEVDLSLTNTESVFNQGYFTVLQSSTGYPALTQEDLDDTGTKYDLPFAKFLVTTNGIESFVDETLQFDAATEVTLTVAGWTGSSAPYTQTVSVGTITATSTPTQGIVYPSSCTDAQRKAIQKAASKIIGITTGTGTITFTATAKPDVALTFGLFM